MKVLQIRPTNGPPSKVTRAFVDIEWNGVTIRDLRIMKQGETRASVACPQISFRNPATGSIEFKTLITFPDQIKGEIDATILSAWLAEREKNNESKENPLK